MCFLTTKKIKLAKPAIHHMIARMSKTKKNKPNIKTISSHFLASGPQAHPTGHALL